MSQHFLLSRVARSLPDDAFLAAITADEATARVLFMLMRWGSTAEQVCPDCGARRAHIPRPKYNGWRCKDCGHDFSVTSKSMFDNCKLPLWKVIKGIYLFVTNSKGRSAIEMSHKLGVSYRTAYLLLHKIRWAFAFQMRRPFEKAEFDLDCVWVLKGIRNFNKHSPEDDKARQQKKQDDLTKRLVGEGLSEESARKIAHKEHPLSRRPRRENPKKQCIFGIARRRPDGKGIESVMGFPVASEQYDIIKPFVEQFIPKGSTLYTDGENAYTKLGASYVMRTVNHSEIYVNAEGWHTNFIESHFSRWRRMETGTYHRMNPRTLYLFFAECAWRETFRRARPEAKLVDALKKCASSEVCREFRKYPLLATARPPRPRRRTPTRRVVAASSATHVDHALQLLRLGKLLPTGEWLRPT